MNSAHLTNLERSLAEASRLLQSGGTLLLNTAYEATLSYPPGTERHWGLMIAGARRLAKDRGHSGDIPNPVNLLKYSADDFRNLARCAGFADVRTEHHTVQMDLPAILAIFGYEGFATGAFPGVDVDFAIACLQESAPQLFRAHEGQRRFRRPADLDVPASTQSLGIVNTKDDREHRERNLPSLCSLCLCGDLSLLHSAPG